MMVRIAPARFLDLILCASVPLWLILSGVCSGEELSGVYGPTGIYASRPAAPVVAAVKIELPQQQAFEVIDGVRYHTSDRHLIDEHHADPSLLGKMSQVEKNQLHYKLHQEQGKPLIGAAAPVYVTQQICNGKSCRKVRVRLWP